MISNLILNSKKSTLLISFTALALLSCPFQVYGMAMPHSIEDVLYAAYQGDQDAQVKLGLMYYSGDGVEKDHRLAFRYYKYAAHQGHREAQYQVGNMYYNGDGVALSNMFAFQYRKLAADQGHQDAQYQVGIMYHDAVGVEEDNELAVQYLKHAADKGHVDAQYRLYNMYDEGIGVKKNDQLAFYYCKLAADQGDPQTQSELSYMYYSGEGVEKNHQLAFHYGKLAADQGDRDAQHQLGNMYYKGNGVEKNKKLAFHYHKLAADQEHAIACLLVENSYFFGRDTESDCLRALDYSYKVYKTGHPSAKFLEYVNFNNNEPLQDIEIDPELLIKEIEDTSVKLSAFKAYHAPHNTLEKPIKFISIPDCYEPYCRITAFQADLLNCCQQIIENVERNPGLFISCLQPNRFFKHYQSNQELFQRVFSAIKIKDIVYCSIGGNNPSIGHNCKQLLEDKDKVLNAFQMLAFGLQCGKQTLLSISTIKKDDLSIKYFDEQQTILTHSHKVIEHGIEEMQNLIKITAPHRNAAFRKRFEDVEEDVEK
jgi:TPR repeat protein